MRRSRCLPYYFLFAPLAFAIVSAPAAGQQPAAAKGTLERITVHGRALEGNLEGDAPDRPVVVYLPPGYARDTNRRYPVLFAGSTLGGGGREGGLRRSLPY